MLIRHDPGAAIHVLADGELQGFRRDISNDLWTHPAAAFNHRHHGDFAGVLLAGFARITRLAADVGFVHFDDTGQWVAVRWRHRKADAMKQKEAGFVAQTRLTMDFQGANPLLGGRGAPEAKAPVTKFYA